jgi:hypothetical protein
MLPHALWLQTSPLGWDGLRHCHRPHDSLSATYLKHKEKPSRPVCAARHVSKAPDVRAIMGL